MGTREVGLEAVRALYLVVTGYQEGERTWPRQQLETVFVRYYPGDHSFRLRVRYADSTSKEIQNIAEILSITIHKDTTVYPLPFTPAIDQFS